MDHIWKREKDGGQSDVYKDGETCIKVYVGVPRGDIVAYHRLQTEVSKQTYTILTQTQKYKGQEVREIEVTVLPLHIDAVEEQRYGKNGESLVTTKLPFIEGESFSEVFSKDVGFWGYVYKSIIRLLRTNHKDITIGANQLSRQNVKVMGFENGKLSVTITDIAQNIRTFVDVNRQKVAELTSQK